MADIFVCYRRADARGDAGRLADSLEAHFAESQVFRDVESLVPGTDYEQIIRGTIGRCAALLAVIGPRWLDLRDEKGQRRLDQPDDFIRLEIASGLQSGVRVIPVLVGGASMPSAASLPDSMQALAAQQAIEISDVRWDHDVARLVAVLDTLPELRRSPWRRWRPRSLALRYALPALVLMLASAGATRLAGGVPVAEFGDSLPPLMTDLAVDSAAVGNCLFPLDCDEDGTPQYSTLIRIDDNVVKHDADGRRLLVRLDVAWKKRQGRTRWLERSYVGTLYYTADYHVLADAVAVDPLSLQGHTLRPNGGVLAYLFGWVDMWSMVEGNTSIPATVRERLGRAEAVRSLGNQAAATRRSAVAGE